MSKIEIWTSCRMDCPERIRPKLVWKGELAQIPRVGDFICIYDGWCSETVKEAHWSLSDKQGGELVEIVLETLDIRDEYPTICEN